MNMLQDILTYIRRIIKTPSNAVISDDLLIDYVNRFWIMDVDARMQVFDLKTKYAFQTTPGVDRYNMPMYDLQVETTGDEDDPNRQDITSYPVYQGFFGPAYVNGVQVSFQTQKDGFFRAWPNIVQNLQVVATGDGVTQNFTFQLPILSNSVPLNPPVTAILRGHVDITGIISLGQNIDPPIQTSGTAENAIETVPVTSVDAGVYITTTAVDGSNIIVTDSGQFLQGNINCGLLMTPGRAPNGNRFLSGGYSTTSNTVNYVTGEINVNFPNPPADGANINVQCYYFQSGLPRGILYYNNVLTLRAPPSQQWLVELDAYLTPAAFLSTTLSVQFAYMAEYIARGAARKILSDTGDVDQFQFYEPLFREQELLVWKRSQRQWTSTRTQTIYSQGMGNQQYGNNSYGGNVI